MWDDDHDKQMMRNQMRAVLLMTVLLLVWYTWFFPKPPAPVAPPEVEIADELAPGVTPAPGEAAEIETAGQPSATFLPPVAVQESPTADEVVIGDDQIELVFTRVGGRLKRAVVLAGENGADSVQLVPEGTEGPDAAQFYPLGLYFPDEQLGFAVNQRRFDAKSDADGKGVTFSLEMPGYARIEKHFRLDPNPHVLDARIAFTNLREDSQVMGMDAVPAYLFYWGPNIRRAIDSDRFVTRELVWRASREGLGENETRAVEELPRFAAGSLLEGRIPSVDWIGFKNKYFLVAMQPEAERADAFALAQGEGDFLFGYAAPRFQAAPGESIAHEYRLYIGPMELASLEAAWDTLPTALTFFTMFDIMDWFAKFLLGVLHWFYENTVANYGVAIILLTVCVRLVLLPLTLKSMKSMKKMQALGPEMKELQEKYKDDQQELSKKMMEMYRERGVNPLGGCLPILLQMPIFIALYRMLWNAYEIRGADFLWIEDLSQPDHLLALPFLENVPVVGQYLGYLNLLPILMAGAMVLNMKVTPTPGPMQRPEQKIVMNLMPIIFAAFCYPLAAGLNLYVLTSTVLGIGQSWLVRRAPMPDASEPVKKDPKKKRGQNFYARAQERQHEMRKEARKARRNKQKGRGKSGAKN